MSEQNNILCKPLNNTSKRFLLGKKGKSELLAIGINPSTANENALDPTSRNIQAIAKDNGCHGWWLINLYPLRTSNPSNLPIKSNEELERQNLAFIKGMIHDTNYNITRVLCCWGDTIDDFYYLKLQAKVILKELDALNIPYQCLATTKKGHPYHPAPTPVNRWLGGIKNITLKPFQL